jgi:hypothetical protein
LRSNEFVISIGVSKYSYLSKANSPKGTFISSAQAEPVPPSSVSKISLISIYSSIPIFANGKSFEPTANLISLFKATSSGYYSGYYKIEPVLQFIDGFIRWEQEDAVLLILDAYLDQALDQKLKVKVTMDDGTVFELETETVVVK